MTPSVPAPLTATWTVFPPLGAALGLAAAEAAALAEGLAAATLLAGGALTGAALAGAGLLGAGLDAGAAAPPHPTRSMAAAMALTRDARRANMRAIMHGVSLSGVLAPQAGEEACCERPRAALASHG